MRWVSNNYNHEGWAACVAPDQRLSSSSLGEGQLVEGIWGQYKRDKLMSDFEVVLDADIVWWRGAYSCGWRGEMWQRFVSPAEADFNRRRDYVSLPISPTPLERWKTLSMKSGRPT